LPSANTFQLFEDLPIPCIPFSRCFQKKIHFAKNSKQVEIAYRYKYRTAFSLRLPLDVRSSSAIQASVHDSSLIKTPAAMTTEFKIPEFSRYMLGALISSPIY
jgi:hypothetical protein